MEQCVDMCVFVNGHAHKRLQHLAVECECLLIQPITAGTPPNEITNVQKHNMLYFSL